MPQYRLSGASAHSDSEMSTWIDFLAHVGSHKGENADRWKCILTCEHEIRPFHNV